MHRVCVKSFCLRYSCDELILPSDDGLNSLAIYVRYMYNFVLLKQLTR